MANIAKVRKLMELMRELAVHLNEDEISDIALVLNRAVQRLEKEQS